MTSASPSHPQETLVDALETLLDAVLRGSLHQAGATLQTLPLCNLNYRIIEFIAVICNSDGLNCIGINVTAHAGVNHGLAGHSENVGTIIAYAETCGAEVFIYLAVLQILKTIIEVLKRLQFILGQSPLGHMLAPLLAERHDGIAVGLVIEGHCNGSRAPPVYIRMKEGLKHCSTCIGEPVVRAVDVFAEAIMAQVLVDNHVLLPGGEAPAVKTRERLHVILIERPLHCGSP